MATWGGQRELRTDHLRDFFSQQGIGMQLTEPWQMVLILGIIAYVAICFGMVAKRYGRNPFLWGLLSVLSPVNGIILGFWAVTGRLPFTRA